MKPRKTKRKPVIAKSLEATQAATEGVNDPIEINYARMRMVSKVVQLDEVILGDAGLVSRIDPRRMDTLKATTPPEYQVKLVDARWWRDGQQFDVGLGYLVQASVRSQSALHELFEVRSRWVVSYTLPEDFALPADGDEILADFVAANGQINVFPYLRQLVNDLSARGGWPPLVLAVFKVPAKRPHGLIRNAPAWLEGRN
jgi:hypothetical protein